MINTAYLIVAVVVAVVFFRIAKLISLRSRITHRYLPLLNALELALWTYIVFGTADLLLSDKSYYPYLVALLITLFMGLLVWFYIKDVVAGFLFRIRHNPLSGQLLDDQQLKGTIRAIGLSQLTIETAEGQWRKVPYSALVNRTLSIQSQHSPSPGETVIRIKLQAAVDPGYFQRVVRETLALSSWCVASKPITVHSDPDEEGSLRISFFMLDPSYLTMAKEQITTLADRFTSKS